MMVFEAFKAFQKVAESQFLNSWALLTIFIFLRYLQMFQIS
jgi:hypothetical protein